MAEANDKLHRARERTPSPNGTGAHLTRHELAELVNGHYAEQTSREAPIDANYIGKLERGDTRWIQDPQRRAAFRVVLEVDSDADLGLRRPTRSRSTVESVDRTSFLRAAAGLAAGSIVGTPGLSALVGLREAPALVSTVSAADVEQVRAIATTFGDWDAMYGGGLIREAVHAQLRYCVQLLNADCTAAVRSDLFSAVGYLGHVTGFMAFDAYAHDDARRMFRFARNCAEEIGDWHLRAKVLSSMARHEIWCGNSDQGLTFTELALVRADRLTPTERAMVHTARARALAKLGRVAEAIAAIGAADEEFARQRTQNDPTWMAYYDAAQHNGDTGHALWDIAVSQGRFRHEARTRLSRAVELHARDHARSRAISQIKLASLTMATGDPTEGAAQGALALEWAGTVRSRRAAQDLQDLRRLAIPHAQLDEVALLTESLLAAVSG